MIPSFFEYDVINEIPFGWSATRFFEFTIEGYKPKMIVAQDEEFQEVLYLAKEILDIFTKMNAEKYAFSRPELSLRPKDGRISIKLFTLDLEEYKERMKKLENKNVKEEIL